MNNLIITGKLIKVNPIENIENKDGRKWIKRNFVVDTNKEFNSNICFQLFGEDKVKLIDNFNVGDEIEVYFNLSSKEFNNRYYHNVDAWKLNKIDINVSIDENKPQTDDELPF